MVYILQVRMSVDLHIFFTGVQFERLICFVFLTRKSPCRFQQTSFSFSTQCPRFSSPYTPLSVLAGLCRINDFKNKSQVTNKRNLCTIYRIFAKGKTSFSELLCETVTGIMEWQNCCALTRYQHYILARNILSWLCSPIRRLIPDFLAKLRPWTDNFLALIACPCHDFWTIVPAAYESTNE